MIALSRRGLNRALLATAAACAWHEGILADPPQAGHLNYVHPELRAAVEQLTQFAGSIPDLTLDTLDATRQAMSAWKRPPLPNPTWAKRQISASAGGPQVMIYVINSSQGSHRPAILHTHGGGFISGQAGDGLADLQELAGDLDCTIVTVEYRLAPETTYAGSIQDTYAALEWLHDHAAELGVDPSRIAVMGESAGGGHAALLALKARDLGRIPLVAQILIYPMLDDRTGTTSTPSSPIGTLVWTPSKNRFGWKAFLGRAPGGADVPAEAVPARRKDLAGLPSTFIGVGSIDLFVDEDIAYAQALIDAGVSTELRVVPGAFHGFDGIAPQTRVARDFRAAKLNALRRAFGIPAT